MTKTIRTPVLIITGKHDKAVGTQHYKTFQFPNQKVVSIDGGHLLYYERNREFVDAVFDFVNKIRR